jgi:preprotein translocase subunit SecD
MTTQKKFLDQIGVGYLWSKILDELKKKASKENVASLENRVDEIETAEYVIYGGSASDAIKEGE